MCNASSLRHVIRRRSQADFDIIFRNVNWQYLTMAALVTWTLNVLDTNLGIAKRKILLAKYCNAENRLCKYYLLMLRCVSIKCVTKSVP